MPLPHPHAHPTSAPVDDASLVPGDQETFLVATPALDALFDALEADSRLAALLGVDLSAGSGFSTFA